MLCEEIVRADQLPDDIYESSITYDSDQSSTSSSTNRDNNSNNNISTTQYKDSKYYKLRPYSKSNNLPKFNSAIALRVISAVMNGMVVMFTTSAAEGKLSDPALVGNYFIILYHNS